MRVTAVPSHRPTGRRDTAPPGPALDTMLATLSAPIGAREKTKIAAHRLAAHVAILDTMAAGHGQPVSPDAMGGALATAMALMDRSVPQLIGERLAWASERLTGNLLRCLAAATVARAIVLRAGADAEPYVQRIEQHTGLAACALQRAIQLVWDCTGTTGEQMDLTTFGCQLAIVPGRRDHRLAVMYATDLQLPIYILRLALVLCDVLRAEAHCDADAHESAVTAAAALLQAWRWSDRYVPIAGQTALLANLSFVSNGTCEELQCRAQHLASVARSSLVNVFGEPPPPQPAAVTVATTTEEDGSDSGGPGRRTRINRMQTVAYFWWQLTLQPPRPLGAVDAS